MTRPNALHSLWGSGDPERDRKRRNTAKSMISPPEGGHERPQEIYTPEVVLDCVNEIWLGEGIALDPCHGPQSIVNAQRAYDLMQGQDGLLLPWEDRTYVNCPYKDLKSWIAKADAEAKDGKRIIMLCPVRPHRKWFRDLMHSGRVEIAYLDPLKFRGFKQAFPAPLCLIFWNARDCSPWALCIEHGLTS